MKSITITVQAITAMLLIASMLISANLSAAEVYKHDGNGVLISGNKQTLVDAALAGKVIAVKIDVNSPAIYHGNLVQEHSGEICLMVQIYSSNITSASSFNAVHAPYSANFCTNGHEYVRHVNGSFYNNSFGMAWIVVD